MIRSDLRFSLHVGAAEKRAGVLQLLKGEKVYARGVTSCSSSTALH